MHLYSVEEGGSRGSPALRSANQPDLANRNYSFRFSTRSQKKKEAENGKNG
jgi:hypothetical protein